jgi:polyhydroxybutyrate depolymerase
MASIGGSDSGGQPVGNTGGINTTGGQVSGGAPAMGGRGNGGTAGSGTAGGGGAGTGGVQGTTCGSTTLPAACNTTSTNPCSIDVNGTTRQFYLVLPTGYDSNRAYPLVFVWHTVGSSARELLPGNAFYGIQSGFPNAIYVAGQGLPSADLGGESGWVNTNNQDVDFARFMITWIVGHYCVDVTRIFSAGFSLGGVMSNTLGCQMPGTFRALGVMSGMPDPSSPLTTCAALPIAAWFTNGDADLTVPISDAATVRDMFITHNGCNTANTTTVTMTDSTASNDAGSPLQTVCTIYNDCTAGNYPVVWCPVPGGRHAIPSWAGAEIAKFFGQF